MCKNSGSRIIIFFIMFVFFVVAFFTVYWHPPLLQESFKPISYRPFISKASSKVNINEATLQELLFLPGIGETKAQAIIDYRDKNGNFCDISELIKVSGIGPKIYNNIEDYVEI